MTLYCSSLQIFFNSPVVNISSYATALVISMINNDN